MLKNIFSYKYAVPFTHTIEKFGNLNSETLSLNSSTIWTKVTWLFPSETESIIYKMREILSFASM